MLEIKVKGALASLACYSGDTSALIRLNASKVRYRNFPVLRLGMSALYFSVQVRIYARMRNGIWRLLRTGKSGSIGQTCGE